MNGIINILKPPGMTSFDVVAFIRKITKIKKVGHTGTLDPMATGVLPICIGKSTGVIDFILNCDKTYRAEITFGANTDTQDSIGEIIEEFDNNLSCEDIKNAICSFKGEYEQIPPMYSAIKINGKKLCDLARKGIVVERNPRKVNIKDINVISINKENTSAIFECTVSKGTYIRTLCYDIGKKLGVGAHMSFLIRTRVGCFDIDNALTIENIENINDLKKYLLRPDYVLGAYSPIKLNKRDEKLFLNGVYIKNNEILNIKQEQFFRVYNEDDEFLAIGEMKKIKDGLFLKSKKLFI